MNKKDALEILKIKNTNPTKKEINNKYLLLTKKYRGIKKNSKLLKNKDYVNLKKAYTYLKNYETKIKIKADNKTSEKIIHHDNNYNEKTLFKSAFKNKNHINKTNNNLKNVHKKNNENKTLLKNKKLKVENNKSNNTISEKDSNKGNKTNKSRSKKEKNLILNKKNNIEKNIKNDNLKHSCKECNQLALINKEQRKLLLNKNTHYICDTCLEKKSNRQIKKWVRLAIILFIIVLIVIIIALIFH